MKKLHCSSPIPLGILRRSERGRLSAAATFICRALIRGYQLCVSPLFPACCRFYPTCSSYALEAFGRYGVRRGFLLSAWRIMRCNPYCAGGYDPVPERDDKQE